jgi:hypothetical protein
MPTVVAYDGHESASPSPEPTIDHWGGMGIGTRETQVDNAGLRPTESTVVATNPGMVAESTTSAPVEERPTLQANEARVSAKAANQDPAQTVAAPPRVASKPEARLSNVPGWVWWGAAVCLGLYLFKRR